MIEFLKKHKYELVLILFVLVYVVYFTTTSFLRYNNYFTGRFDLGNMDQTVWNTIHGRIFQLTDPDGTNTISRLSIHADFILILISPLYLLWADPRMLLLLQSVVLACGAFFVFLIAAHILRNKNLALTFAAVYLLNPAMQFTNLYDFHGVVLATTFLLGAFYYFLKRRYLIFLSFAILAGLTKEDIWAVTALLGAAVVFRTLYENHFKFKFSKRQTFEVAFGTVIFFAGIFMSYLLIAKIIPLVKGGEHFALTYYSDFGATPSGIIRNIILEPIKTFKIIFTAENLSYLIQLFSPLGFLSLLSPLSLIFTLPDLAINLLSNDLGFHQIYYQYTAAITPFILISAIYGTAFVIKRVKFIGTKTIIAYLILVTLITSYLFGPLPGAIHANVAMLTQQLTNRNKIDDFLINIPNRYSIAASNNLGSHLSHRRNIYTIPNGIGKADVILFLLNDNFAQPSLQAQKQMAKEMSDDKNYLEVYRDGDFIAFEKRSLYKTPVTSPKKGQTSLFPYSITALSNRGYEPSQITLVQQIPASGNFTSFVVSYQSDGLKEYALMNVPNAQAPTNGFPVVIIDHGYIQPNSYDTVNSYKAESDYFANQGFLVLKPDYRGNGKSEDDNQALMRFAYPIDVLTLISSLPNVPQADESQVFLWSHSMGGEVTLEVLEAIGKQPELAKTIKAAVFWAPVTDPVKWFSKSNLPNLPEAKLTPYPYTQTFKTLGTPDSNPTLWKSLSPLNYLKQIKTPVLLQHGTGDTTVPYVWSEELNADLTKLGKSVKFISYPNDTHNLPLHWTAAISADNSFYQTFVTK